MLFRNLRTVAFFGLLIIINLLLSNELKGQEQTMTAGFQFKPLFSSKFFSTGPESREVEGVNFTVKPGGGYCFGMVLRRGITPTISIESGINYVKRNYSITIRDTTPDVDGSFSMISYDIPLLGLVFIQLSDNIYMDVGLGFSLDFFPSDLRTKSEEYEHYSARKSWFSPAVLANLGWEYRTEKSGYFYFGASFHRPFDYIYGSYIGFTDLNAVNPYKTEPPIKLSGNFLTADFRYFFHSDPLKKKKKTKKNDPRTR
jgi:hypothetical protein